MKVSGCDPYTAVALVLAFSENEQLGLVLPEQGPLDHRVKAPVVTEANNVMAVPDGNVALQVEPQAIPAGVLETLPDELPFRTRVTVSVKVPDGGGGGGGDDAALNTAVTVTLDEMATLQVPVPEQPPPLQPANTEPEAGVAVNVTVVPLENDREQVVPQLIPLGLLVTVPEPVPDFRTVSVELPPLPLPLSNCGPTVSPDSLSLPHPTSNNRPATTTTLDVMLDSY
jgi:hypothetical protein